MKTTALFILLFLSQLSLAQFDDKFYQPSKTILPIEGVFYTEFIIPVENNVITGIFLKPTSKAKATILFFHGAAGNVSTYMFITKPLVEAGYQVIMADVRGYGKSTGETLHKNVADDGQRFLNYALSLKDVKDTKIIIYGASMGSQVATYVAKNNQQTVSALILDGAISSLNDVAILFAPQAESFLKTIPFPFSAKEDIKTITIPKLFIHSEGDKTIPLSQGKMVYENAPNPKTFMEYDGDHLQALVKDKDSVLKLIAALIK